jgi:hypothetical protein
MNTKKRKKFEKEKKKPGMVAYAHNPSTQESEAGEVSSR